MKTKFYFPYNNYSSNKEYVKRVIKAFKLKWNGKGWSNEQLDVRAEFEGSGKPATFWVSGDEAFLYAFSNVAKNCGAQVYW